MQLKKMFEKKSNTRSNYLPNVLEISHSNYEKTKNRQIIKFICISWFVKKYITKTPSSFPSEKELQTHARFEVDGRRWEGVYNSAQLPFLAHFFKVFFLCQSNFMASFAINHGVPQLFCDAYIVNLSCVSSRLDFLLIFMSLHERNKTKRSIRKWNAVNSLTTARRFSLTTL